MKKKLLLAIEVLAVGLLVFILTITSTLNALGSLDYMVRDSLYQVPRGISSKIKIIGIDEKTLMEYGPIQSWSRGIYADLLDKLNGDQDARPLVIGFDIQYTGHVNDDDYRFAEACADSGNVVVVDQLIYGKKAERNEAGVLYYPVVEVDEPYEELAENVKIGFSNVAMDSDGKVRRVIPSEMYYGEQHDMFAKVMYEEYARQTGTTATEITIDRTGRTLINYSGRPGDYEFISMADVLDGKIDPRAFVGSVVFVGAYAPGMQDSFEVPSGGSSQMYGVEIHANIFESYLDNRFAVSGNAYIYGLITAIIAMLLHFIFRKLGVWQGLVVFLLAVAAQVTINVMLNNRGVSFSIIYFPLVVMMSYIYMVGRHYLQEKNKKKKILKAFQKYVAPQIVEEISKKGDFELNLSGENRDIAVLFVDIRGFTTMSEALEPETVVEILNEYLALTTKSIFDNSGTLDKFVGDATMAVFNSPFDLPDYEYKAVSAAMDIVKGGEELEKKLFEKYGRSVGFGVGVNCGPAVVGNVGCEFRMDFTAIGDTVNTSARLEANAKKGQVLISDTVYDRLKDRIEVTEIGEIPLKGKSKGVMVYQVDKLLG